MCLMRARTFLLIASFASGALAVGSSQPPAPVSQAEVRATLVKIERALGSLPGMSIQPGLVKGASKPASRAYIVLELSRLFNLAKPNFKFSPRKVRFDPRLIAAESKEARKAIELLVAWGCVSKAGPLASGAKTTIGLREFGDAVGFFVARIAELTHTPDFKYSPGMMHGSG